MGFNRGLGISLLKETLKLIHPTTVIEIKSRFAKKNYECSIGNFVSKNLSNCNFMTFKAMPESLNVQMGGSDNWGIPEAYKLRDIVTLSFLEKSKVMSSAFSHTVSLDSIHIQLLCPELVLNTALVSLGCKLGDPTNQKVFHGDEIIPSKGFGVVTGINQEKKLLYLK